MSTQLLDALARLRAENARLDARVKELDARRLLDGEIPASLSIDEEDGTVAVEFRVDATRQVFLEIHPASNTIEAALAVGNNPTLLVKLVQAEVSQLAAYAQAMEQKASAAIADAVRLAARVKELETVLAAVFVEDLEERP